MSYLSGSNTGGGGGFVNPMPLDTFLQGTRSDSQVVNIAGVSDDFGGDALYVGDFQYNTPLLLVQSDGFVTGVRYAQFGANAISFTNESSTDGDEMIVDFNRSSQEFQHKYETSNALPLGIKYKHEAYSLLAANNDILHTVEYKGYDTLQNEVVYAAAVTSIVDVTAGSSRGQYSIQVLDSGLYSPMVFTGATRIDVSLTAGLSGAYTALYNEADLTETFTDYSNYNTVLNHNTQQWQLEAEDIGLGYNGVARFQANKMELSLDDGFGTQPVLSLDYTNAYLGYGAVRDLGFTVDTTVNSVYIDGLLTVEDDVKFNSPQIGFYGAAPTGQSAAIADATGGATVDAEARTAINTLLAYLRLRGDIAP